MESQLSARYSVIRLDSNKRSQANKYNMDNDSESHNERENVLERLEQLAKEHHVSLRQFWRSNRVCINFEELEEMLEAIGISILNSDRQILAKEFPERLVTLKTMH